MIYRLKKNIFYLTSILFFFSLLIPLQKLYSQTDSINHKRLKAVTITGVSAYAVSLAVLNYAWYQDYPRSSFHFFNDNKEWLQMDKCGHLATSYYVGYYGYRMLKSTGINHRKALWLGGLYGSFFLTTIEILDGFSSQWGFSPGDFAANTLGSALFVGQQLAWNEQRVQLKWSFHQTSYSSYRKDLFGSSLPENMLKDYNGQSYWLSFNINSFLNKNSNFPKWLNMAVGYGADGMLGGRTNPDAYNGNPLPVYDRTRKFFFSPDIDLTRIHTKSRAVNTLLGIFGFIKIPAPTVEINTKKQTKAYLIYF